MKESMRSLVWMDYIQYALTDFTRLGQLFERQRFLPMTLLLPAATAITDILCLYRAFGSSTAFAVSLTYGSVLLVFVHIISAWVVASLITTAFDTAVESVSLLRHLSIVNMSYIFKLFVLPLVSFFASISVAPAAFLVLGQITASIAGIVCISFCLSSIYSMPRGRSMLLVLLPCIVFVILQWIIVFITVLFLFHYIVA